MPYLVITTRPWAAEFGSSRATGTDESRRAVATLEEACAPYATGHDETMEARYARSITYDYLRLWEPGTPPLRLSDGTVIEVARVPWWTLATKVGHDDPPAFCAEGAKRSILDAYNAQAVA